ncbi:corticotropin-releasing factor-binding protein [Trichonephila clavata]|uniref:Corticotropin-releasing factor-binding protein n=1 Tax=Trichonephila clavata TaxID=2740835 RepID=A0A8X6HGV9_TRICU|nr:corticotropin-releasing factor-binding protein [Trichonephila clavata]
MKMFEDPRLEDELSLNLLEPVQLEVDEEGRKLTLNFNIFQYIPALYYNKLVNKSSRESECIFVKSEEGFYSFTSPGTGDQVCGLYIIAEPDKEVEFEFQSFDISCTKGGLISVIDGWELNGQFFPSPHDHPLPAEKRYTEFCGKSKPRKSFRSSQNVGLLEFRIPTKGQGFSVVVRFHPNPKPCNAVLQDPTGTYTLRNFNRKSNCSISVIFPLSVRILASSVGIQSGWPQNSLEFETGLLSKVS